MLYQNNFEAGWLDFHWQGSSRLSMDAPIFTTFNGWQSNTTIDFHVAQATAPTLTGQFIEYTLLFDFYAFDSWDGDGPAGSDRFMVFVNDALKFNESFSNTTNPQSFRAPDMPRSNLGGRTSWNDAIYRNIALTFSAPLNDPKVRLFFQDSGLGGYNDESWGLDNFRLSYSVVPTPGTAGLTLAGAALIAGRRRRKAR
jgi:MYXO-CTERM domain-containing protein